MSPAFLMVTQKMGGIVAGAFDSGGRMLGFVFGMTGVSRGQVCHWSHMLAVRASHRDQGIGARLKDYQKRSLLRSGVESMRWTYDPLVARNAHVNLNRLGVRVIEYVPDFYGSETKSSLDRGIGTDRFVVEWSFGEQVDHPVPSATDADAVHVVDSDADEGRPQPVSHPFTSHPAVTVAVPSDIQTLKTVDLKVARAWRRATRAAFTHYLGQGYRVVGFYASPASGRGYRLEAPERTI